MESVDPNEKNYLTSPEEIYRAIQRLIRYAHSVTIQFEESEEKFSSAITKVDLKTKAFAFDKLVPDSGNELIRKGKKMKAVADFRGILVEFHIDGKLKYRSQSEEYIGRFPEKMLYLQRRAAYRAIVPRTYTVYVMLRSSESDKEFKGRLQDISGTGFKAYFKGEIVTELQNIASFDESTLHVGDESMDCGLDAKHALYNEEKSMTFCGFSFQHLSGMKQRYIDQLVQKLQWEEQRKEEAAKERKAQELSASGE